ncbi:hypothetical protein SAMN05428953_12655 [Mesorhizobium muleiense]|uniref:Uncharacterized protein n=1 Tax=Mesorhizobium muleiense TaxID=1004279 RepID=A0A1G9H367_9HYPH|nr:hypothetical protein [Mesorhizobium muleiense]SDL07398.1 hypothetical protein SAMN05428953_12655 [Mesorhizobium muleiense]
MAQVFNEQRVLGVRLQAEGATLFNGLPVFGVVDATSVLFSDNQRTLGVNILDADAAMHNDQPVRGVVVISDGRKLYNGQLVVPVSGLHSAEALALFARFTTPPTDARKTLINNRILAAKASGAWALRDGFYMMAAADAQAGQRNWKADAFNLSEQGTIAFAADRGYTGDGATGYLATGFTPSAAGGQFALNSAHMSLWSRSNAQSTGISMGARTTAATAQALLILRNASDNGSFRLNQDVTTGSTVVANSSGGFVARRSAADATALWRNGVSLGTHNAPSTALPAAAIVIGAMNTGGVIGSFSPYQFASVGFGGNLSDAQILAEYQADLAYLQAVGAA